MSLMVCSEIGEINTYKTLPKCQLVRDVVTAVRTDTIVFPHVSSCLGVIFELPANPHGIQRIGVHLVVSSVEYGFGYNEAVNYYKQNRILRQYCMHSNAYCFSPVKDWEGPVKDMLKALNVNQYHFHRTDKGEVNAWVTQNTLSLTEWTTGSSKVAAQSEKPVGAANVINLNTVIWSAV